MIREQLIDPPPAALAAFLNRHTRSGDCLVQIAGLAEVTYPGRAASTADVCMLLASRRSPAELVQVIFLQPQLALALELQEAGTFVLSGSEAQMQELLAQQPELIEPGLRVLDRELLVESGGIDLYAQDERGRYVVVELKRARATQHAVSQLARYVRSVEPRLPKGAVVRGILAAPSITTPALKELESCGLEFREVTAMPTAPSAQPDRQPSLFD
ncbi:endonuclease NucS domain-containing protein [Deinococcus hohokamensis]|uniref:Endonuclease NucS domain-containing protein n=1 Tax=Deinococcus hohokamensis TaxID=309883 RepID=A0ABV9I695_9DEIO